MKISYNWIKKFLKTDLHAVQISEILTDLGLEVEGVTQFESIRGGLKGVVVGEVINCEKHPNADRLRITKVDIGTKTVQIICGATNIATGQKVAVAKVGTLLYDNQGKEFVIKKTKIRGELSHGMICAEDELGLAKSNDGIMVLDSDIETGTPCSDVFDIEFDTVFEIGLTPNRADAMSHMGVARDLRAYFMYKGIDHKWFPLKKNNLNIFPSKRKFSVSVESEGKAPRYMGVNITNLMIKPSPQWLQNRLRAIGIVPKNNVIDITNFVLHDIGQPLHAFDLDKISSGIIVKNLSQDTPFITLDGVKRELHKEDLMICDHQKPLCIAGVYGGLESGITQSTSNIFLESAYFDPVGIRKSAKRHGLNTDASFRFERGIDPEITIHALKYAANMIVNFAGGTIEGEIHEIKEQLAEESKLMLSFEKINKTIGQEISKNDVLKILKGLEIKIEYTNEEIISIQIPSYRVDVTRPSDVIEEILRIYGYNNVNTTEALISKFSDYVSLDDHQIADRLSNQLVNLGFNEIINNPITSPDYGEISHNIKKDNRIDIINPLSKELSQMRTSLLPGALEVIAFNLNRQSRSLKLFEIGNTYQLANEDYYEEKFLSLAITGNVIRENWNVRHQPHLFFYSKGVIQQILEKICSIQWDESSSEMDFFSEGLNYSYMGKSLLNFGLVKKAILDKFNIDQQVLYAELDFKHIADLAKNNKIQYKEIPKFPKIRRDFALLLDISVPFDSLKQIAQKAEKNILNSVQLFDVYEGDKLPKGKKSYGVSFYFQDPRKTLTDKFVDKIMAKLKNQFEKELGAQLR